MLCVCVCVYQVSAENGEASHPAEGSRCAAVSGELGGKTTTKKKDYLKSLDHMISERSSDCISELCGGGAGMSHSVGEKKLRCGFLFLIPAGSIQSSLEELCALFYHFTPPSCCLLFLRRSSSASPVAPHERCWNCAGKEAPVAGSRINGPVSQI